MNEFLIQGVTLEATANKIRDKLGLEKLSFKKEIGADKVINSGAVMVYYKEYIDYLGDGYDGVSPDDYGSDVFIAYDFIADNNGVITPVIYKTDIEGDEPDTPDYADQHFYVGQAEIDGTLYDKWRKIEPSSDDFNWDSVSKKYIYTNLIIDNNEYSPTDFPTKIEDVYNVGYEAGSNSGITLPTLTNPGTAADLLAGRQLIDGNGNIVEGTAKSYDDGLVDGQEVGYDSAIADYAPLIIQGKTEPQTGRYYDENAALHGQAGTNIDCQLYPESLFEEVNFGEATYSWREDISYEVAVNSDEMTILFSNNSNHYVRVFVITQCEIDSGNMDMRTFFIVIAPNSIRGTSMLPPSGFRFITDSVIVTITGFMFYEINEE